MEVLGWRAVRPIQPRGAPDVFGERLPWLWLSSGWHPAGGRTTLGAAHRFVACDHRGFGAQARVIHVTVFGTTTVHKATDITGLSACQ